MASAERENGVWGVAPVMYRGKVPEVPEAENIRKN